jgi:hypothetical protein
MTEKTKEEKVMAKSYAEALMLLHAEMPPIKKDTENPFYNSKYADLKAIMDIVRPLMVKYGFVEEHVFTINEQDGRQIIKTIITHVPSGQERVSVNHPMLSKGTIQEFGSAVTYVRRYAISAMLGIIVEDDDDDGNAASSKGVKAKPTPPVAGPRPRPKSTVVKSEDDFQFLVDGIESAENLDEIKEVWSDVQLMKSEFPVGFLKKITDKKNEMKQRFEDGK